MKRFKFLYFNLSLGALIAGILIAGFGALEFTDTAEIPTVSSVSEVRNNLGERVKVSTAYARYTDIDVLYGSRRGQWFQQAGLETWWHDKLYFVEFWDGAVVMRAEYRRNQNLTETHEYIIGRVHNTRRDRNSDRLIMHFTDSHEYLSGRELDIILVRYRSSERIRVIYVDTDEIVEEFFPFTIEVLGDGMSTLFLNGRRLAILGVILLIPYGIWWVIDKIKSKRRERIADMDRVF